MGERGGDRIAESEAEESDPEGDGVGFCGIATTFG